MGNLGFTLGSGGFCTALGKLGDVSRPQCPSVLILSTCESQAPTSGACDEENHGMRHIHVCLAQCLAPARSRGQCMLEKHRLRDVPLT